MMEEQNSDDLLEGTEQDRSVQKKGTVLIYSWGRNEDGELAIPNNKVANTPTPIRGFRGLAKEVASARTHTAIITIEGQIYMAGSLLFGKIGITAQVSNFRQFHLQAAMNQYRVSKVACGDYHTLALTDQGALFSWGGSLWDKTGHKGGGIHKIQRLSGQQIVDIACGDFHSLALNNKGEVYSWGGGGQNKNKGQLGHSNKKDLPHPELIQFFKNKRVTKIACGDYHTMVLTSDEELFAFGQGNYGQLGTGKQEDAATPKKVALNFSVAVQDYFTSGLKEETKVQQLSLGGKHSLILTNKGHIYVCGYGAQGQLGLGATENKYAPALVQSLLGKLVVMVAAGANHSLCLTQESDIYSCGYNAKGQLGIGDERSVTYWTHVSALQGRKTNKIYAGGDHSWAVLDEYEPFIKNYQPPSPLRLNIDAIPPIPPVQAPSAKSQTLRGSFISVDNTINEMSSNRKLQLILTEVELSHRFIHFTFRDKQIKNCKALIDSYIEAVIKAEGDNLKFYKLNQDGQIYDGTGQLSLPSNPRGMSIMLVCEVPEDANQYVNYLPNKSRISIGDIIMMDGNSLKVDGKVPTHNFWFFKFSSMFQNDLQKVRFLQMRPKRY